MKTFNQWSVAACAAFVMVLSANPVAAQQGQGRGNFDPAELRQRMMDNYRERLEIKGDDDWKAIQPLIEKVAVAASPLAGAAVVVVAAGMPTRSPTEAIRAAGVAGSVEASPVPKQKNCRRPLTRMHQRMS